MRLRARADRSSRLIKGSSMFPIWAEVHCFDTTEDDLTLNIVSTGQEESGFCTSRVGAVPSVIHTNVGHSDDLRLLTSVGAESEDPLVRMRGLFGDRAPPSTVHVGGILGDSTPASRPLGLKRTLRLLTEEKKDDRRLSFFGVSSIVPPSDHWLRSAVSVSR